MDFERILLEAFRASTGPSAAAYAMLAIGLNVHFGYTGLLNFGQVGFMLVGGYGLAITVTVFGGSFWLGLLVGILSAVALALLLGLPTLRLRADYLAITTIATAEILRFTFRSRPLEALTGGPFGLQRFADSFYLINPFPPGDYTWLFILPASSQRMWVLTASWTIVLLAAGLVWLLTRSPWGRVLRAIREDEDAARSLGKNVFSFKMQALVLGGVFGAIGGMLLGIHLQAVQPEGYLPIVTFYAWTILILGGPARSFGPVVGAVIFWFLLVGLEATLRQLSAIGIADDVLTSGSIGAIRLAAVGLALMLLMAFRPQGLFGNKREMQLDV